MIQNSALTIEEVKTSLGPQYERAERRIRNKQLNILSKVEKLVAEYNNIERGVGELVNRAVDTSKYIDGELLHCNHRAFCMCNGELINTTLPMLFTVPHPYTQLDIDEYNRREKK